VQQKESPLRCKMKW